MTFENYEIQMLVSINKVLLEHSTHISLWIIYASFHATTAQSLKFLLLDLYRSLLIPHLKHLRQLFRSFHKQQWSLSTSFSAAIPRSEQAGHRLWTASWRSACFSQYISLAGQMKNYLTLKTQFCVLVRITFY